LTFVTSTLLQVLSCPICCELFRDPVVLTCSHSFCKVCLENWWEDKPLKTCPVCKRRSSRDNPPTNLVLKNLVETFTEERGQTAPSSQQPECSLHSEKLRLFCLDHQELICLVCRDSRTHKDHRFRPIEEAASDLREQLRRNIKPLQDKLKVRDLLLLFQSEERVHRALSEQTVSCSISPEEHQHVLLQKGKSDSK
uniref:Uncharacterized protein n=1 Tax=Neogobius melanostomus TaxID=47308 RepID=A0A8C6TH71_9GOBI